MLPAEDKPEDLLERNIVAVIPAFNEARFIGSIVLETRQYCRLVIVVDDGSTDGTDRLALMAGADVIRHAHNLGKGAAMNTALHAASQHHPEAVVMLDADGQHSPAELARVVQPILQGTRTWSSVRAISAIAAIRLSTASTGIASSIY